MTCISRGQKARNVQPSTENKSPEGALDVDMDEEEVTAAFRVPRAAQDVAAARDISEQRVQRHDTVVAASSSENDLPQPCGEEEPLHNDGTRNSATALAFGGRPTWLSTPFKLETPRPSVNEGRVIFDFPAAQPTFTVIINC